MTEILPVPWLLAMGRLAAPVMVAMIPPLRESLLDNARHLLGPSSTAAERRALARGVLVSFARFVIELLTAHRRLPVDDRLFETMRGREHYDAAMAAGRGIIAISLHMGNYEVGPMLLARLHQPIAVVFNRDPIGLFDRARTSGRRTHGIEEIPIDDSPFYGLSVLSVLRRGGIVLLAGDLGFGGARGEPFPFMDGRAGFLTWPATLALSSGAPMLPCFIVREAGRYQLEICEPIIPGPEGGTDAMMSKLVAVYERMVRRYPDQWLIVHRYWEPS